MVSELEHSKTDLVAVTYISHSLLKPEEAAKQCQAIKRVASKKNAEARISGILLFRRNRFIQRLEGQREAIDALIKTIKADKRHRNFSVLYYSEIPERYFSDWSQMEVVSEGKDFDELDQLFINLESGGREVLNDRESRFIVNFIQHFKT